jgi:hypothetical protein
VAVNPTELTRELHELIAALDRRVPRVEQAGEAAIARDAVVLRERAVQRLRELDEQSRAEQGRSSSGERSFEAESCPAVEITAAGEEPKSDRRG